MRLRQWIARIWERRWAFLCLLSTLAILLYYVGSIVGRHVDGQRIVGLTLTRPEYYTFSILLALTAVVSYWALRVKALYPIVAVAGLVYALGFPYYSPIDEGAHFAYVRFVANHHALPVPYDLVDMEDVAMMEHVYPKRSGIDPTTMGPAGRLYEAQHPPLYYFLAASVYSVIPGDVITKLYGLRLLGLFGLLITAGLMIETYHFLVEGKVLPRNDFLFFCVALLFTVMPGILLRMTTITNAHLLVPLASLALCLLVKLSFEKQLRLVRHILPLGAIAGALFLTHYMSIIAVTVATVFVLAKTRSPRRVLQFLAVFAIIVAPWFAYNYHTYHQLTPMPIVKQMLHEIMNPRGEKYGVARVLDMTPKLLGSFWAPEEGGLPTGPGVNTGGYLCVMLLLTTVFGLCEVRKKPAEGYNKVAAILAAMAVLNVALLAAITFREATDSMMGRYLQQSVLAMCILFYAFSAQLSERFRGVFGAGHVVIVAFLWTDFLAKFVSETAFTF